MTDSKTLTISLVRTDGMGKREVIDTLEVSRIEIDRTQYMRFWLPSGGCAEYRISHHINYSILPK